MTGLALDRWGLAGAARLVKRFPDGYWGDISVVGLHRDGDPLVVDVYSAGHSIYVQRAQWGIDASVTLPPNRVGQVNPLRGTCVRLYGPSTTAETLEEFTHVSGIPPIRNLTADNATDWLTTWFAELTAQLNGLCNYDAMYRYLTTLGPEGYGSSHFRAAALLAHHHHKPDDLAHALHLDKEWNEKMDGYAVANGDEPTGTQYDRRKRYDLLWSPERFRRFIQETPPD